MSKYNQSSSNKKYYIREHKYATFRLIPSKERRQLKPELDVWSEFASAYATQLGAFFSCLCGYPALISLYFRGVLTRLSRLNFEIQEHIDESQIEKTITSATDMRNC